MTLYLDCNATTPLEPRVQAEVVRCFQEEPGNAGSPHEFGQQARRLVNQARDRIARVVAARRHEVIFTSGATESNNLAILGLESFGKASGRRHIISTGIEHKAVLEPLAVLKQRGFEVTLVNPTRQGCVDANTILEAVRSDTLLVSVMHVNNETGVIQPIAQVADGLGNPSVLFHVDAAQGYGKDLFRLKHPRIDLISVSSHKIHGPVGVGALIARRTRGEFPPMAPLSYGGGQELGLRPGTLPVALISGFGLAAELANKENDSRLEACRHIREIVLAALSSLAPSIHGDLSCAVPNVVNLSFPGQDADDVIERLAGLVAVSTGSACTSVCATASHVLQLMEVPAEELDGAIRISWSHMTDNQELSAVIARVRHALAGENQPNPVCGRG
jgi:cysteine desulfurase